MSVRRIRRVWTRSLLSLRGLADVVEQPVGRPGRTASEQMIPETFGKILSFPDYFSLGRRVYVGCETLFGVNPAE
jgi:hypothetical protein